MNPSSAIALTSSMPGARTPDAASFFSACLIVSFLPHPTRIIRAATRPTKPFRAVRRIEDLPFSVAHLLEGLAQGSVGDVDQSLVRTVHLEDEEDRAGDGEGGEQERRGRREIRFREEAE